MKTVYIFLAEGFEEIEAITPLDLLRRVGIDAKLVSTTDSLQVRGAHGAVLTADLYLEAAANAEADALILPGGMPGTTNLLANEDLCQLIKDYAAENKYICAICAAPMILGALDLLHGKKATIFPGMEKRLLGAKASTDTVCVAGNIITSRAPGTAIAFSLKLAEIFAGASAAEKLKADIVYQI